MTIDPKTPPNVKQSIGQIALVVRDYDEAIHFLNLVAAGVRRF